MDWRPLWIDAGQDGWRAPRSPAGCSWHRSHRPRRWRRRRGRPAPRHLHLQGRRPRREARRARQAGRHGLGLHLARADRGGAAGRGLREEVRRQGADVAGAVRRRRAARPVRGARQAPRGRRDRDQRPRDGGAGARATAGRIPQPVPGRPAAGGAAEARDVGAGPAQLLRRRLQHRPSSSPRTCPRPTRASSTRSGRAGSRSRRPTPSGWAGWSRPGARRAAWPSCASSPT